MVPVFTNDAGNYAVSTLAVGTHTLRVLAAGYREGSLDNIVVRYESVTTVPEVDLVHN